MAKKKITILVDEQIVDRVKDIVYWNPEYTVSNFVEASVEAAVEGFSHIDPRPQKNLKPGKKIT